MSIETFLKKHKEALRKRQKSVILSIEEANLMVTEISSLLHKENKEKNKEEPIQIQFDAGFFKKQK